MKRRTFLAGVLASPLAARGVSAAEPSAPLSFEELYTGRLLFGPDGRPLLTVGMMQGKLRVEASGPEGLEVWAGGQRLAALPAGARVVVDRVQGKPAVTQEGFIVETLEGDDRSRRREVGRTWSERGAPVRFEQVGGVYGMRGTVVDNRAVLMVLDDKPAESLKERYGARPVPQTWLRELPSARLRVTLSDGRVLSAQDLVELRPTGPEGFLVVHQVEHSIGYPQHGFADRELRGRTAVCADSEGKLAVVNVVDEDTLVAGILPSEMFASAPLEAIKAQAVTARGEIYAKIGRRHFTDPYLVCSSQHCQVYRGRSVEKPRPNEAARATAGELAFHSGRLVDSVYSACCGGHTEPGHIVWDRPPQPSLIGTADAPFADPATRPWRNPAAGAAVAARDLLEGGAVPLFDVPIDLREEEAVRRFLDLPAESAFCGRSSFNQKGDGFRWTRTFTEPELTALCKDLGVGRVRRLRIPERGPGGRLRSLTIEGDRGKAEVLRELPVRQRLVKGKRILNSGLFVIDEERDAAGQLLAVTLRGAGLGHGSGMCQQGAIGMAEAGYTYREILRHYYGGAEVKQVF